MNRVITAALLLCVICAVTLLCACSPAAPDEQSSAADETAKPVSIPTPTPAPTVVPEVTVLGRDGLFEDSHVRLYIPAYLEYDSSPSYNSAYFSAVTDEGYSIAFGYLPDEDTSYEKEIGGLKRTDYAKQIFNSSGASLEEFKFVTVAGHEALRTLVISENVSTGAVSRTLTFFINVEGWLLTLTYSTNMPQLPAECEQGILDMVIKTDAD